MYRKAICIQISFNFSSSRSIKRKKFDDELVEYSLGLPGVSNIKVRVSILIINLDGKLLNHSQI